MEPNFQTSFIPKRPMIEERVVSPASTSLFTVISIIIFFAVILASAGLFFYKGILAKNLTQMEADLNLAKARFEPSKIVQLQQLDRRLNASKSVLAQHVAVSPIFETLQDITLKTIQYTNFGYKWGEGANPRVEVTMKGAAVGYRSIALQSDLFTKNEFLIDPVFSNLSLDESGKVLFDLKFSVDPNLTNYKNMLQAKSTESAEEESAPVGAAEEEEPVNLPN